MLTVIPSPNIGLEVHKTKKNHNLCYRENIHSSIMKTFQCWKTHTAVPPDTGDSFLKCKTKKKAKYKSLWFCLTQCFVLVLMHLCVLTGNAHLLVTNGVLLVKLNPSRLFRLIYPCDCLNHSRFSSF